MNADETALFYQMLPLCTLALKGQRCEGGKNSKQIFSVLLCVNIDGSDKRVHHVIGKSKNPHCFRGKRISVEYASNTKAWMSRAIFGYWVTDYGREMSKKGSHVCLLLDNCSAHHVEDLSLTNVDIHFLPPNCTSLIQPLDQGIINSVKCAYRGRLIDEILLNIRCNRETKVDVIQAIEMLAASWESTKQEVEVNCFKKAGFCAEPDAGEGTSSADAGEMEEDDVEESSASDIAAQWDVLKESGSVPEKSSSKTFWVSILLQCVRKN